MRKILGASCLAIILSGVLCLKATFNRMEQERFWADITDPLNTYAFLREDDYNLSIQLESCQSAFNRSSTKLIHNSHSTDMYISTPWDDGEKVFKNPGPWRFQTGILILAPKESVQLTPAFSNGSSCHWEIDRP